MKHNLISTRAKDAKAEPHSGCGHGPAPAARRPLNAAPIFVNGVAIEEAAIAQEAQNHSAHSAEEARAAAARALVIRELLLQRAREVGLEPAPLRDPQGREEAGEEALIRQVLEIEVKAQEPTEEECRRFYQAAPGRFRAAETYEASHILIAPAESGADAGADAESQATRMIEALGAGADFAQLASAHSACPSSTQGGALGRLRRGDLAEELEQALLSLEPGAIASTPIRTKFGWHVVRLDRRSHPQTAPFETVADFIRSELRERASIAASARYLRALAAGAAIEGLALEFGAPQ